MMGKCSTRQDDHGCDPRVELRQILPQQKKELIKNPIRQQAPLGEVVWSRELAKAKFCIRVDSMILNR